MKVLFIRNEFEFKDYLTWLGLFLRFFENRWYNHLAIYEDEHRIVHEFVGSGYQQTSWYEWNLKNLNRKFIIREFDCDFNNNERMKIITKIKNVLGGYEFKIFWALPLNWIVRKITFNKINTVITSTPNKFFCSDWIAFWILKEKYNPKLFYKLTYFENIKENEKIHLSSSLQLYKN